jgi:myo-inositol-1(or 4)-monophosphatase
MSRALFEACVEEGTVMVQKKKAPVVKSKVTAKKQAAKPAVKKSAAVKPQKVEKAVKAKPAAAPKNKPAAKKEAKPKPPAKKKDASTLQEKEVRAKKTALPDKAPAPKPAAKPDTKPVKKAVVAPAPKPKQEPKPVKKEVAIKTKQEPKPVKKEAAAKPKQDAKPVKKEAAAKSKQEPKPVRKEALLSDQQTASRRQSGNNLKFLVSVAQAVKDAVAPLAQAVKGREVVDEAPSGDVTFLLDRVAEKALFNHLKAEALPVAYYSEHEGYSTFSSKAPKSLLIVDPIDGTRAAKSGFEGCVVAVASTRVIERPTIADIDCACVMDIMGERIFLAERGKGARVYVDGKLKRPKLSENVDLESMIWSMTIPARPAELIFPTAARIIDLSSLKGGFFACNSTSFSLTRLVTNQLDACIDIANRYYRDIPDRVEDYFINAGRGKVIGVAPYDIAASLLIAQEAGCVVTDAYGRNFDDLLLLDSSKSNHQSIIAASNAQLHEKLLNFFDTRIRQYEQLLTRHAGRE